MATRPRKNQTPTASRRRRAPAGQPVERVWEDAGTEEPATQIGNDDQDVIADGVEVYVAGSGTAAFVPVRLRSSTSSPAQLEAVAALQALTRRHMAVLDELDATVGAARAAGLSWATIGWSVGLTEAGARKRWSAS